MSRARSLGPLAFVVIAVVVLSAPVGWSTNRLSTPPSAPRSVSTGSTGAPGPSSPSLSAAEWALAHGRGPAAGGSWICQSAGPASASCGAGGSSSGSTGPARPTPTVSWANPNASPPADSGASMAYDPADHEIVLVGAECYQSSPAGPFATDTTWLFANNTWTPKEISPSPASLCGSGLVWDARDGYLLLFGGAYVSSYGTSSSNDTWTFLKGSWTNLNLTHSPSSNPPVSAIGGAAYIVTMTYDSQARCVVLYQGATLTFRATWEFAAGAWKLLSIPTGKRGPLTSTYHLLAYDSTDGYAVLYSGFMRGLARVATTWGFSNGTWKNLTNPAVPTPVLQWTSVMVNDPARTGVLIAGVTNSSSSHNQFWEFSRGNWTSLTLGGTPSSVVAGALAFESSTSRIIVHPSGPAFYAGYSATWALVGLNWSPVRAVTSTAPPARYDEGLAPWGTDGAVLFGGCGSGGKVFSDTWFFAGGFWTNITSQVGVPPAARCGMVMIGFSDYVLKLNGVLVYGGTDGRQVFSDTWLFNGTWHRITTLGRAPPARYGAAMAYDNPDNRYVLFGGRNLTSYFGDTWYIRPSLGGWSKAPVTYGPSPRSGALMNFQVDLLNSGRLNLFGGRDPNGTLNDTWEFYRGNWTLDNGPWLGPLPFSNVIAESSGSPHGPIVEFGGSGTPGATWFYEYDRWYQLPNVSGPPARTGGAIAHVGYDFSSPGGAYFLVFGGRNATGVLGDTWLLTAT
jgi:hypothetical protein